MTDITETFMFIPQLFAECWRIFNVPIFYFQGMPITGATLLFGVVGVTLSIWFIKHFFIKNGD